MLVKFQCLVCTVTVIRTTKQRQEIRHITRTIRHITQLNRSRAKTKKKPALPKTTRIYCQNGCIVLKWGFFKCFGHCTSISHATSLVVKLTIEICFSHFSLLLCICSSTFHLVSLPSFVLHRILSSVGSRRILKRAHTK